MGTVKDESRRKSCDLHVRLTEADMETVHRNCRIAGYKSISRFVRTRLTSGYLARKNTASDGDGVSVPEWLREEMGRLSLQIRGVASNYNQSVAVMNTLVRHVADKDSQRQIVRRAARLDTLTHEMIRILREVRELVDEAAENGQ